MPRLDQILESLNDNKIIRRQISSSHKSCMCNVSFLSVCKLHFTWIYVHLLFRQLIIEKIKLKPKLHNLSVSLLLILFILVVELELEGLFFRHFFQNGYVMFLCCHVLKILLLSNAVELISTW